MEVRGPRREVAEALSAVPDVEECDVEECDDAEGEEEGLVRCRVRIPAAVDRREELAAAVTGRGWGLRELHTERVSLEDVFHELTGGEEN